MLAELAEDVALDQVTKGRLGQHLTAPGERGIPLVRTTTAYTQPARCFAPVHHAISEQISGASPHPTRFNHALLELYDGRYRKMGFHCDQALDLAPDACIAIVSCYLRADGTLLRRGPNPAERCLVVKHKDGEPRFEVPLVHGSVVLFSVATNAHFLHKIVLPGGEQAPLRWLGLTLRQARTFLSFDDGVPRLMDGSRLTLADETQRRTFFELRGRENRSTSFVYPSLSSTSCHPPRPCLLAPEQGCGQLPFFTTVHT